MQHQTENEVGLKAALKKELMVIKALGVVFGDIGTSPIYTLAVIFMFVPFTPANIMGLLSMIIWTLILLITVQYVWLATSLSQRGEGGAVVLTQILIPYLRNAKGAAFVTALGIIGISLLIGDGVITPAISILSAVEGIALIDGFEHVPRVTLLILAGVIAFCLFAVQKKGVERVASAFGPIMIVWFFVLGFVGAWNVIQDPLILRAISPTYAVNFVIDNPLLGFIVLADVILCATGGEALYADMGHLGRLPIMKGWLFAGTALMLNYLGQGAFLLDNPSASNSPLFEMVKSFSDSLYVPFVILTLFATVIASQAMISGVFSVLYQAMTTRMFPHFHVEYTSHELRSQIYVGSVNWFLFFGVVVMLLFFQESSNLAAAYGLADMGAMTITGALVFAIFYTKRKYFKAFWAAITAILSLTFFASCLLKVPHGAYWSILLALIPFTIIYVYINGQKRLYAALAPVNKKQFLEEYSKRYSNDAHISGIALFFARRLDIIPSYIDKTMFQNGIMYERNIIVTVTPTNSPHGITTNLKPITDGLENLDISVGYMEMLDVDGVLHGIGINERTIFYGDEDIMATSLIWKFYGFIKDLSPSFVNFYKFPQEKLIGVTKRVQL
ncbi:MAG: hypothetical protein RL154_827 [Pseudomonadota bacterium]|jgi:KUP system potassium uptake protein